MPVLKDEIYLLRSQLDKVSRERNILHDALKKVQTQVAKEVETTLDLQAQNYEIKLTELHSVIGELKKQLELHKEHKIDEESGEDEEEDECGTDLDTSIYEEQSWKNLENSDATGLSSSKKNSHNNAKNSGSVQLLSGDLELDRKPRPTLDVCYIQTKESLFSDDDGNRKQESHDLNSNNVSQKAGGVGFGSSQKEKIIKSRAEDLGKDVLKTDLEERKELKRKQYQQHQNFSNHHKNQLQLHHQETKTRLRTKTSKGIQVLNSVSPGSSSPEKEKNKRMPLVKLCPNDENTTTSREHEHHPENSDQSSFTKLLLFSSLTPAPQPLFPSSMNDIDTETVGNGEVSTKSNKPNTKTFTTSSTTPESSINSLFHEVASIRKEHSLIRETLSNKETELDRTRFVLESIAKERDFLKNKVNELEQMLKSPMSPTPYFHPSPISGNNYTQAHMNSHAAAVDSPGENNNQTQHFSISKEGEENDYEPDSSSSSPIFKIAERVKLVQKKHPSTSATTTMELSPTTQNNILNNNYDSMDPRTHDINKDKSSKKKCMNLKKSFISGPELIKSLDSHNCNPQIIEQLLKPIQDDSRSSELEEQSKSCQDSTIQIIKEFCIEFEKLQSKLEHATAQNNVLSLNLNDAKDRADDLSLLLGQYESNNMALKMILGHSDQVIEAYDVLVALLESELGQLLANCRAAGLGSPVPTPISNNNSKNNNSISQHLMITDGRSCHAEEITTSHGSEEVYELLTRAYENRVVARNAAISLLHRSSPIIDSPSSSSSSPMSENNDTNGTTTTHCGDRLMILNFQQFPMNQNFHQLSPAAWEDISSGSQTMSSESSNNSGSKENSNYHTPDEPFPVDSSLFIQSNRRGTIEQRVRELIIGLKTEREKIRSSVIEDLCNNWNRDLDFHEILSKSGSGFNKPKIFDRSSPRDILEARKLDLETAVIMQELMGLREERAELRAQLFLIEKDKSSLRTQIENYELGEVAYRAKIDYLSNEISEMRRMMTYNEKTGEVPEARASLDPCSSELNNNNNCNNNSQLPPTKETTLKNQIRELVDALEKVTFTTEERERRHSGIVNEFKNANSVLLQSLEETKRKYQCRIKKMEEQILSIIERHTIQSKLYREKICNLEIELNKSSPISILRSTT